MELYIERGLVKEMRGDIPIEEIPREVEEVLKPYLERD